MRHNINITLYTKNHIICALYGWVNNLLYIRYYLNLQLNVVAKCITHHSVTYTTSEICSSWHALYRWQTVDNEQKKHNCRIYLQLQIFKCYQLSCASAKWIENVRCRCWRVVGVAHIGAELKLNRKTKLENYNRTNIKYIFWHFLLFGQKLW